ncbi:hypothetical protein SLS55_005191 [Diplodia seriata]|uniref:Uncharacterized protein n=1 Tax=Diplodia seriata TaxID=420778 RepID=A0ABR3CFN9_9PEZI
MGRQQTSRFTTFVRDHGLTRVNLLQFAAGLTALGPLFPYTTRQRSAELDQMFVYPVLETDKMDGRLEVSDKKSDALSKKFKERFDSLEENLGAKS